METAACWIERLPEELLAAVISLTSPPDACRVAAVSQAFLAAADSDAAWCRFLPRDLPRFVNAYERSFVALPSCKARFLHLSDDPALLLGRVTVRYAQSPAVRPSPSPWQAAILLTQIIPLLLLRRNNQCVCSWLMQRMWLDKATGGKCYMLSARALDISWGDAPNRWRWIHLDVLHDIKTGKRIASEAAQLLHVAWLEVRGKIESRMLSPNYAYGVYLVFQLDR
ncbi:hypothetical protein ACQ4PT_067318 [Festuca glaucescens]